MFRLSIHLDDFFWRIKFPNISRIVGQKQRFIRKHFTNAISWGDWIALTGDVIHENSVSNTLWGKLDGLTGKTPWSLAIEIHVSTDIGIVIIWLLTYSNIDG